MHFQTFEHESTTFRGSYLVRQLIQGGKGATTLASKRIKAYNGNLLMRKGRRLGGHVLAYRPALHGARVAQVPTLQFTTCKTRLNNTATSKLFKT